MMMVMILMLEISVFLQAVTEEIYKLLESKCGLHKIILPVVLY